MMSLVGNWPLLSKILLLLFITLLCSFQYSQCQFHNKSLLCHPHQSLALLQFKSSFVIKASASVYCGDQTSNPKTETWKEGTDCCSSWDGVTCHPVSGHVIGIDLSCSQLLLQLQLDGSAIFSLRSLKKLNLAGNDFNYSNIPSQVNQFASTLTHLNLSDSNLSGTVPSEISHLSNLVSLDLSINVGLSVESDGALKSIAHNLTHLRVLHLDAVDMSSVPQPASSMMNLSSSLVSLSLKFCALQGKFPDAFLLFPSLQELYLSDNDYLQGPLPKSWPSNGNTSHSKLRILNLQFTTLSGELPSDFVANLKSLMVLDLSDCNLSGSIPASLGNLTKINQLDLSGNQLSGTIPSSIGYLMQLVHLNMAWNMLSGQIPNGILNLTQLEHLSLSDNQLEGPLPSSPSHSHALFPHLQDLDLSDNLLNDTIPPWLFALPSVALSNNKLSGPLPRKLSKSVSLRILYLSNNLFNGTIPSWLFALPSLETIDLGNNRFTGHLDEFVSQALEVVDVRNNKLSGPIPRNLSKSVSFRELLLHHNFLTGSIAQLPWKNIMLIDLHSNLLEGPLPVLPLKTFYFSISNNNFTGQISPQICNATSLQMLDLSFNQFYGLIPPCLGNISHLSVFNLGMNNFHGTIPDTFSKGSELTSLNLNGNQLRGVLPRSLFNCEELEVLDLDKNLISDVFPKLLGVLPQLQVLALRSNKFYGFIHIDVKINHSFPMLRILDLSNNHFSGALPTSLIKNLKGMREIPGTHEDTPSYMTGYYGESYDFSVLVTMKGIDIQLVKILTIFTTIDLSNNRFEGAITKEIGNLLSLKGLNLSNNCLTGFIPPTIGKLVNLEWLDLSSNQLIGKIPPSLVDLNFLAVLDLSHNNLHGPIPIGKQFNTFQAKSYEGNTDLCGFPLSKTCGSGRLNPPIESSFQSKDSYDSTIKWNWKSAIIGYGCGMIFGIGMGYLVFSKRSPEWFVRMVEGKRRKKVQRSKRNVNVRGSTRS